ncbi:MAG: glycoside hydrolase family 16 protein [Bacteroidales bacterium]|nr:glycoside hydrolase family 16 protein [Bacteroidales bacterium]
MRRIAFFTIITLLLVSCAGKVAPTPEGYVNPDNKKEWKMIWNDEFDYQTRDQLLQVWESSNAPTSHTICSRWEENLEVGGGTVRLVNHKESRGGQDWTSADMGTLKDFKYGYFESRYKYAAATGTNNSFWLWTRDPRRKLEGGKPFEIDINEGHYPSEYTNNVHEWLGTMTVLKLISSDGDKINYPDVDFSKEYHLFGVDWEEDEIIFYMDRKETRRVKNEYCHSAAPIRLSMAILASWAGEVNDAIDGTFMEVDYVRVYSRR